MGGELEKDALRKLLESGDKQKCLQFFQGMPERSRRDYFAVVKPFWSQARKTKFVENVQGSFSWNPLEGIACLAYFATATGSEIIRAKRSGYPDSEFAFEVIADRRPDWVDQWVESLLDESYFWNHWRLIRRLILAGLANKPTNPRYFLAMISGVNSRHSGTELVDELEQAPDLLEEDIWKLFEYEGDGENSLANTERFNSSWIEAFLKLVNRGKLPRAKLLESCIDALERDFNHYRAKWFYSFFDRLEPTDGELEQMAEKLLGLLGASAPNVASWALERVDALSAYMAFEASALCHAMEPILRSRAKVNVLKALRLLERQADLCPTETSLIAATATLALAQDTSDVQKATLKLLESISSPRDEKVRLAVDMLQPTLAPSVRNLAIAWLASGTQGTESVAVESAPKSQQASGQPSSDIAIWAKLPRVSKQLAALYGIESLRNNLKGNILSIPAATFDGTDIPRLGRIPRVARIDSVEELIDECARVIEDGSRVNDAECCIDGLARLANSKPADFDQMAAPLMKRLRNLIPKGCSPFCGLDPGFDVMGLFYAFCSGKVIEPTPKGSELCIEFEGLEHRAYKVNTKKPIGFLSAHCLAVARRIASGDAWQLLSAPTHTGGWIDPRELAKRANAWTGADPHAHDVILAMLRLAPDNRVAALKSLKYKSSEWFQAICYALGAAKINIDNQAPLWVAAARARAPWRDDDRVMEKHPGLGPDAAEAAKLALKSKVRKSNTFTFYDASFTTEPATPKTTDPLLVTVMMYTSQSIGKNLSFEMGGFAGRTIGAVRWTATIWPQALESYFASSAVHCFSNLDWWEAEWQNRTMLEPLIDSGTPLRYAGLLLLSSMLAAKEPGESGLATDIAVRAIEDGRLGSDNLGNALANLLISGLIKSGRWHKTLSEIARTSQVHAAVVQLALQRCFENPKQALPRDSNKLLELLYELSLELGVSVTSEPCRAWLSSGAAIGKGIKLAKNLLALGESPESKQSVRIILEQAVVQRTTAASRRNQ